MLWKITELEFNFFVVRFFNAFFNRKKIFIEKFRDLLKNVFSLRNKYNFFKNAIPVESNIQILASSGFPSIHNTSIYCLQLNKTF